MSDDLLEKRCSKCGEMRPITMFARNKRAEDGRDYRCKTCEAARYRANADVIRERSKIYREENAEIIRESKKKYNDAHREEKSAYDRARYEAKGEEIRAHVKAYREANPEIIRERKKKHYRANRERILTYLHMWQSNNTEYLRQKSQAYYATHSEIVKVSVKKWSRANPEKVAIYRHRRRALILANGGTFTLLEYKALIEVQKGICAYCGNADIMTIEHIIPLSRGGRHDISNICLVCPRCNCTKGAKLLEEWTDRWYLRGK